MRRYAVAPARLYRYTFTCIARHVSMKAPGRSPDGRPPAGNICSHVSISRLASLPPIGDRYSLRPGLDRAAAFSRSRPWMLQVSGSTSRWRRGFTRGTSVRRKISRSLWTVPTENFKSIGANIYGPVGMVLATNLLDGKVVGVPIGGPYTITCRISEGKRTITVVAGPVFVGNL
jgi:hypothetical protein